MHKPSIVLDVDHTLITCKMYSHAFVNYIANNESIIRGKIINRYQELKNIIRQNGVIEHDELFLISFDIFNYTHIIMKRPYLLEFIITINKYFDIYVYSTGSYTYIHNILNEIGRLLGFYPFKKVIANPDGRNRFNVKKLINLDVGYSNVIIIDDNISVWLYDKHHVFKIKPYEDAFIKSPFKDIDSFLNGMYELSEDNKLFKLSNLFDKYFKLYDNTQFDIFKFKNLYLELEINKINDV